MSASARAGRHHGPLGVGKINPAKREVARSSAY